MAATRKLRIRDCQPVYKGTGAHGEYTIYEVDAVNADTGQIINLPLRSFEHLEMDEVGEFTVEKYERPGKDTTYTLKKPTTGKGGGNALGPKLDKLRERVDLLEGNVETMRANLADVMAKLSQTQTPVAAGGSIHQQPGPSLAGQPPVDDIPF